MYRNLIKVALRNIQRQKFYSILNITGLTIGLASCLFITLYVTEELSFDTFHEKADRIYRIDQTFIWGDLDNPFGSTGPAVAEAVQNDIPEFETITRIHTPGSQLVSYDNGTKQVVFEEEEVLAADANFFDVFSFSLKSGNATNALEKPHSVIITEEMAKKYFGDASAMGKTLQLGEHGKEQSFTVTGVLEEIPSNSHIDFDFLLSNSSFPRIKRDGWSWIWTTFVTFGVLNENANVASVQERLLEVPSRHAGSSLQKLQGISFEEYVSTGKEWKLYAQPLLDIHLRAPESFSRLNEVGDIQTIYILGSVGILILLISLINFMNLATARSANRAKEVGIRKVIGSRRGQLMVQFLVESITFSMIAMGLAVVITVTLIPAFNSFSGMALTYSILDHPIHLLGLGLIGIVIGILGGLYPSVYLTSFEPASVLKGKLKAGMKSSQIRNVLVVVQFTISIIFISSTLIVFKQLNFTNNYDLGFDRSNKLIINDVHRLGSSVELFREQMLTNPQVHLASYSDATPPYFWNNDNFKLKGSTKEDFPLSYVVSDENFVDTYALNIIAGRKFQKELTEENRVIVNEALIRQLGFSKPEDALQRILTYYETELTIIGVVSDFNPSFEAEVLPWALVYEGSDVYGSGKWELSLELNESISGDEMQALVAGIENQWLEINPNAPFHYTFLDQQYATQFESVVKFGHLLTLSASLAILIACLGLIGLVAFVIEKRNKEIGIRKVLGASIYHIMKLLTSEFGKLLLVSFLIATPVAWWLMDQWLQDFAYRTNISLKVFLGAGVTMLIIAFVTTSFQTIRAALMNPVESIKDE